MKRREPVSHIMTKEVVTVSLRDSLRDVKEILSNKHIRHIPVVEGGKLVGIISRNDIMRLSFGDLFDNQNNADEAIFDMLKIEHVMAHNPVSVHPDDIIRDVADKFVASEFHALTVADGDKLVGIVTTTDIIKYMLEQY